MISSPHLGRGNGAGITLSMLGVLWGLLNLCISGGPLGEGPQLVFPLTLHSVPPSPPGVKRMSRPEGPPVKVHF